MKKTYRLFSMLMAAVIFLSAFPAATIVAAAGEGEDMPAVSANDSLSDNDSVSKDKAVSDDSVSDDSVSENETEEPEPEISVWEKDMLQYNGTPGYWVAGIEKDGYTYTGKAVKPEIRLYKGKVRLWPGRDYSVSYKNNKKANSCDDETLYTTEAAMKKKNAPYVKITLKGQYSGTIIRNFKITKKSLSENDVCVITAYGKLGKKALKLKPEEVARLLQLAQEKEKTGQGAASVFERASDLGLKL